ncbi:MAG TPA: carboxypeptidase regulatory-like domain-containing protein [Candidatus Angelobacter sp.]|nr:carboxypeptidase regulatory-like domain-containing protein [Candidatus Angelobacter sp.]
MKVFPVRIYDVPVLAGGSMAKLFSLLPKLALVLLCLACPMLLHAETISGTVLDPSGAVIVGARIEISGGELSQPIVFSSDAKGRFVSPDLKPGNYSLRVTHEGFEPLAKTVDLHGTAELELKLAVATQHEEVVVSGKGRPYANSDPIYRQLRNIGLGDTFRIEDFTLHFDTGTFHLQKGTLTLLNPVSGTVTGAIFIGEGHFNLKAVTVLDGAELKRRSGSTEVDDDFTEVVFRFTGGDRQEFLSGVKEKVETPGDAARVFDHWKEKVRKTREVAQGFTEYLLHGETMDNVDADVLAAVYNPGHPRFVNAYLHGRKHQDMRFFLRMRVGALPQLDSPEEVALINYDQGAMDDGVWYLSHLQSEYTERRASSSEDRRLFATRGYKIETIISKKDHLFSTATISFEPLLAGERVLKFGLLPNLRVSRVVDDHAQDIYYVQESRKEDGSFYVILPQAPALGKQYSITVQYEGDKVLESAGDGSFYVKARTSWYPNLNGFGEHALYDLTFKVPKKYKVISVGSLKDESIEQDYAVTHWVTPGPVAVAGFNYGNYQKLELADEKTGFKISGYYLTELPDNLSNFSILRTMAPKSMTKYALEQTRAQLQLCNFFFGKIPYNEISVTEQPDFNFGQSWPNLVYLPISAYTDSTQRWMLFGTINSKFSGFVQEVTPHEVAHQWWGHAVGWASYHDQWLSEGFAEFSAGLFLQQGVAGDWRKDYIEFWDRLQKRIVEKNNFGIAPNDAGPLWMGLRLISPRTANAYQNVTYPKGAYVLQMLRSIMYSPQDQDKPFIDMMHDFVESHADRPASTETFKAIVQKHMSKTMDLAGNGRMDWFFNEWVYGTQIPKYHLDYQITPAEGGKANLHMTLTQSDVDDQFLMLVPVFADFGKGMVRIGQLGIKGNSSRSVDVPLPMQPKKVALNAYKEILER